MCRYRVIGSTVETYLPNGFFSFFSSYLSYCGHIQFKMLKPDEGEMMIEVTDLLSMKSFG